MLPLLLVSLLGQILLSGRERGSQLMMMRTLISRKCVKKISQMKSRMGFHPAPLWSIVCDARTMRSDPVTAWSGRALLPVCPGWVAPQRPGVNPRGPLGR